MKSKEQTCGLSIARDELRLKIPTWLWPNVLALDAPFVALVWQEAFARMTNSGITLPQRQLLFLAVWFVYVVDRWLDARRNDWEDLAPRHRFHIRFPAVGPAMATAIALTATAIAVHELPPIAWLCAIVLAIPTALHCCRSNGSFLPILRREVIVGAVFAGGCFLIPAITAPHLHAQSLFAFGLVGWLFTNNCLLITRVENLAIDATTHAPNRYAKWPTFECHAALSAILPFVDLGAIGLIIPASSLLLLSLKRRGDLPTGAVTTLADGAILLPPLLLLSLL